MVVIVHEEIGGDLFRWLCGGEPGDSQGDSAVLYWCLVVVVLFDGTVMMVLETDGELSVRFDDVEENQVIFHAILMLIV